MSERGGEFIPVSNLERSFTVGKEVFRQEKINGVAEKAKRFEIFDDFETQEKRKARLNEVVGYASDGVISSYEELINRSCDTGRDQTKIEETFDVLKRGFSLAINSDQMTQTSLNIGGLGEILPEATKYDNQGAAKLNLAEGILEVTITNPKMRDVFRRGSEIMGKSDRSTVEGRRKAAREMESLNGQLEDVETEAKTGGFESEWNQGRAYFDVVTGTLYGEMGSNDSSVDKTDEEVMLGGKTAEVLRETKESKPKKVDSKNEDDGCIDSRDLSKKLDKEKIENIEAYAKKLLDTLECSSYRSNDLAISRETTSILNEITDWLRIKVNEGATKEYRQLYGLIDSRLALHDSAFHMSNSGFKLTEHGGIIGALDRIKEEGRCLDKDRLKFLLEDSEKSGLLIADALDFMEEANFDYRGLLTKVADDLEASGKLEYGVGGVGREKLFDKIDPIGRPYSKGTTVENLYTGYWLDLDDERKALVDAYLVKQLSITKTVELDENDENGHPKTKIIKMDGLKALQLAKKLVEATGERSVFNFGLVNGDDFAELIHFAYFRADDARKGKNVGPMSTMGIQTLTPGWLRTMSGWDTNSGKEINTELKVSNMDLDNNEGKNTVDYYFRQIVAAKLIPLKLALLDSSPDPKKMLASGAAHFNSIVDCFNKAEPPLNIVNIPNMGYLEVKKRSKKEIGEGKSIYYIEGVGNFGKEIYDSDNDCFSFVYNGSEIKSEKSRDGRNGLRAMYGLGLLELIATKEGLGWDNYNIMKLRKAMVETNLNLTAKPFWNANMWDWANNQILAHDEKGKGYNFKQALLYSKKVASRETFFKGFMDGIKGKRS